MTRVRALLVACALWSCAAAPRPRIFADVEAASGSAQAREAKELAPQAHAAAEALRARAESAHREGDTASAQILAEHALAAYGRAFVLARLARAERALEESTRELARQKAALADVDDKLKRVTAEADQLELRVRVAEDAVPLVPNAPAGPEREKARLEAARALASQARLLCVAARLLEPSRESARTELDKLAELDRALAGAPRATPIDAAVAARSACLAELTAARRPNTRPAAGVADGLLAELSRAASFHPFRDDRGVVVTLRGLFDARGGLTPDAARTLEALARVARAHPGFPVLVVFHGKRDEAREQRVAEALRAGGAPAVEVVSAGNAQPVVDPARPGAAGRNERVEIVFVAPAS